MARGPLALARPQVPVGFLSWAHLEAGGARWPLHLPQPYSVLALISGDLGRALGTPSASTCRAATPWWGPRAGCAGSFLSSRGSHGHPPGSPGRSI